MTCTHLNVFSSHSALCLKTNIAKKMGFVNCKNAAQFPFMQPKNTSLVPNTTPFIDFGLNLLATGRIEHTIRITVVMSPVDFSFFNRVHWRNVSNWKIFSLAFLFQGKLNFSALFSCQLQELCHRCLIRSRRPINNCVYLLNYSAIDKVHAHWKI